MAVEVEEEDMKAKGGDLFYVCEENTLLEDVEDEATTKPVNFEAGEVFS